MMNIKRRTFLKCTSGLMLPSNTLIDKGEKINTKLVEKEAWDRCKREYSESTLTKRPCYVGFDLSSYFGVAGYALVFPPNKHDVLIENAMSWHILTRMYLPEENLYRLKIESNILREWGKQKHVTLTSGNIIDYDIIAKEFYEDYCKYGVKNISISHWDYPILEEVLNKTINKKKVKKMSLGFMGMSSPTHRFINLLLRQHIYHNGNPLLRYMANNVFIETDPGRNINISVSKSNGVVNGILMIILAISISKISWMEDKSRLYL